MDDFTIFLITMIGVTTFAAVALTVIALRKGHRGPGRGFVPFDGMNAHDPNNRADSSGTPAESHAQHHHQHHHHTPFDSGAGQTHHSGGGSFDSGSHHSGGGHHHG